MARPALQDRSRIKEFRLTVKVPHDLEARVKQVAARKFEGNFSALVRTAIEQYLVTADPQLPNQTQEG